MERRSSLKKLKDETYELLQNDTNCEEHKDAREMLKTIEFYQSCGYTSLAWHHAYDLEKILEEYNNLSLID